MNIKNIVGWFKNWKKEIKNFVLQVFKRFYFFPMFYDTFLFYSFRVVRIFWGIEYQSLLSKIVTEIKNITLDLSILSIIGKKIFENFFM